MPATASEDGVGLKILPQTVEALLKEVEKLHITVAERERLAGIGQLTASILHEVKNPLNFVINFSKVSLELVDELKDLIKRLEDKVSPDEREELEDISDTLQGNFNKISENGERANRIIMSMLAQSRNENAVIFADTDINQLVDEFTKLAFQGMRGQHSGFNVSLKTDYDPAIGIVKVDAHDLSRAIVNIVSNACYAVNEKKKKLASDQYKPQLMVTTKKIGPVFCIVIKDNGMGIPESILERIFTPFFTTKPSGEGTGLGLSVTNDIVTKIHKGKLEVFAEEGQSTEFTITIPML